MSKGLAREGFDIDLAKGKEREEFWERVLRGHLVEVKCDHKAVDTGNVFIEYRQKGRPSGIAVTTADYWLIEFLPERCMVIRVDELKNIARRLLKDSKKRGGDFDRYEGVAIPLHEFLPKRRKTR
jgi:hypothetical protein